MALLPTPVSGRLLRWAADGTLENVTISDLLDQIARGTPPDPTAQKYWIDTSALVGTTTVNAPAGAMTVAGGTPTVVGQRLFAVTLTGASMTMAAGTPTVAVASAGNFSVTAPGASMAMAAGMATVGTTVALTLTGASMALSGGTPSVSTVTSFAVTLTGASMAMGAGTATVATAGGGPVAVSDNFNRANSNSLGSSWATITGMSAPGITSNKASGQTGSVTHGALYSGASFSGDQFSEIIPSTTFGPALDNAYAAVRVQPSARSYYGASEVGEDDGEGGYWYFWSIFKVVDGTRTVLASVDRSSQTGTADTIFRLEVSGSSLTLKTGTVHGSLSTRATATDSTLSGGSPGFVLFGLISLDDWYGGDL